MEPYSLYFHNIIEIDPSQRREEREDKVRIHHDEKLQATLWEHVCSRESQIDPKRYSTYFDVFHPLWIELGLHLLQTEKYVVMWYLYLIRNMEFSQSIPKNLQTAMLKGLSHVHINGQTQ